MPRRDAPVRFTPNSGEFHDITLLCVYLSTVTLAAGLLLPSFTMIPSMGGGWIDYLMSAFVDELEPQSFSIIGGIIHLFEGGDILIAAVLMIFSVLFPAAKLGVLYLAILSGSVSSKVVSLLAVIGKWSMLDVFVIALLVVAFKGFPGGSRIELNLGAYFFATSVLLSMFATHAVKARWPGKEAYERPRTTH